MFFRGGGGSGPLSPLWIRAIGPDNVYTYWDILKTHFIVRIGFCTTLHTFYRMHKFLNWRNILSWIPFGSDLDRNCFCKCKFREKERETGTCTSFRENQRASTYRQVESIEGGERDGCSFWISSFYLRISKFRVYLCKKFWSTRCPWLEWLLHYKRHLRRWRASESVLVNESETTIHR